MSNEVREIEIDRTRYTHESAANIALKEMLPWKDNAWFHEMEELLELKHDILFGDILALSYKDFVKKIDEQYDRSIIARVLILTHQTLSGARPNKDLEQQIISDDGWDKGRWAFAKAEWVDKLVLISRPTTRSTMTIQLPSQSTPTKTAAPVAPASVPLPVKSNPGITHPINGLFSAPFTSKLLDLGLRTLEDLSKHTKTELQALVGVNGRGINSIIFVLKNHGMKLKENADIQEVPTPEKSQQKEVKESHLTDAPQNNRKKSSQNTNPRDKSIRSTFIGPLVEKIENQGFKTLGQLSDLGLAQIKRLFGDDRRTIDRIVFNLSLHNIEFRPCSQKELDESTSVTKLFDWSTANIFRKSNLYFLGDLTQKSPEELLNQFGKTTSKKILHVLREKGLQPKENEENLQSVSATKQSDLNTATTRGLNGKNHQEKITTIALNIPTHLLSPDTCIVITIGSNGETTQITQLPRESALV